ncbi:MAG: SGNH/GDSL hydrolase family protein [Thermostichus sp. DG_1_5_bins_95]
MQADGQITWESNGSNRWIPLEPDPFPEPIIVEDGSFGWIPSYPYGYYGQPTSNPKPGNSDKKIVVLGSSVALGCSAWLLRGWAWHLEQALQERYGYQLINLSELGANVQRTLNRFSQVVTPEKPDIVIVALSLGNEGLAFCSPQDRVLIQKRFENGLKQLILMTEQIGALPILGGVYPHRDYTSEHRVLLQETHHRMLSWGYPVLNWLPVLEDGQGGWKEGLSFDAAHPNSKGHQLMFESIDLSLFKPQSVTAISYTLTQAEFPIFLDGQGFGITINKITASLRVINTTPYDYILKPDWQSLQVALQKAGLQSGLYIAEDPDHVALLHLSIREDGTLKTTLSIPAGKEVSFLPAAQFFSQESAETLFDDGCLILIQSQRSRTGAESTPCLYIINTTDHEYNIHPMWKEVRAALKAMPAGVYRDPQNLDAPFRTLMIGEEGLESRVKAPPHSVMRLEYQCPLSEINRVAIVPLGDRCAARMLLYKLEYDGPAFPFDLTRTTNLADVADMIQNDFQGMWDPRYLHYSPGDRRIYHSKWTGLSFGHEVEETDDPVHNMQPVYERMRTRYSARAKRFQYVLEKADKLLFVRTGGCQREVVMDLMAKLKAKCQNKPFLLLIISPQSSDEFAGIPNVVHYDLEFNPDRMYADHDHWKYCTEIMRNILHSLGISSQNLFWCPPQVP